MHQTVYASQPTLRIETVSPGCYGGEDGRILLILTGVEEPASVDVKLEAINRSINFTTIRDTIFRIEDIPATEFMVRLSIDQQTITEENQTLLAPEPLEAGKINLLQTPAGDGSCNGALQVIPQGGTPPYTFTWSENAGTANKDIVMNIRMGIYRCEINDQNGCGPVHISIPLFENTLEKYTKQPAK